MNNSAYRLGGSIYLFGSAMKFCGTVLVKQNSASFGGAIHMTKSSILFGVNCSCTFMSNFSITFQENKAKERGGAIGSHRSNLYFMGSIFFYDNTADYGGAIMLHQNSSVIFKSALTIHFIRNIANIKGGVFYCDTELFCSCKSQKSRCFLSFDSLDKASLVFVNNSANLYGTVLYHGQLGECGNRLGKNTNFNVCKRNRDQLRYFMKKISSFNSSSEGVLFSADTEYIQFCCNTPCSTTNSIKVTVLPGQHFKIALIAYSFDSSSGIKYTSTQVIHKISNPNNANKIKLIPVNNTRVNHFCTSVYFYLTTVDNIKQQTVSFNLYHDNPCGRRNNQVTLSIYIEPCPLGFQLLNEYKVCTCDKRLQSFTKKCDINKLSIEWKNIFWVSKQVNDSGLILHSGCCPFDFCKDKLVNITLNDSNIQCDFNRTGTLCGQCREQYSLALGTLHCLYCAQSSYIALVLPFALAGIALVMVILLLHLTVDVGTLNGLIFYANIVHSNREAYFQHTREITNFHAIFISWLKLDFGIETCFYNGMNIYTYSWLQFLFPFYLWFLISAIIFICRYSQRVSRSLGRNPVAALGTVLFLSYGKILNAVIAPLSKTELLFTSNDGSSSTRSVWLYDGSVQYFTHPKHIALGLFAVLILLLAFVPYTFILLCGHWLIAYSDKCFLSWFNKIKPVLDVYYAPFKQGARYWIGLTLLARSALLLTIAISAVGSDSVNILVIASVTAGLLSIKGRVYTHRYNDMLESSFILNLCIFSIATFFIRERDIQNQLAILNTSIGITFVTFLGIIFFHIYFLLKSTCIWNVCVISMFYKSKWLCKVFGIVQKEDESIALKSNDPEVVTSTLVELREPLIDNDEV